VFWTKELRHVLGSLCRTSAVKNGMLLECFEQHGMALIPCPRSVLGGQHTHANGDCAVSLHGCLT
jgi:hypothetical protein